MYVCGSENEKHHVMCAGLLSFETKQESTYFYIHVLNHSQNIHTTEKRELIMTWYAAVNASILSWLQGLIYINCPLRVPYNLLIIFPLTASYYPTVVVNIGLN